MGGKRFIIRVRTAQNEEFEMPELILQKCVKLQHISQVIEQGQNPGISLPILFYHSKYEKRHLMLIFNYCLCKARSQLAFPLKCNKIENNLEQIDQEFVKDVKDNFNELTLLMKIAKDLGCESFYQLMAACLASWFRCRTHKDVQTELKLQEDRRQEEYMKRLRDSTEKLKFFIDWRTYPELVQYTEQQRIQQHQLKEKMELERQAKLQQATLAKQSKPNPQD
uniref:Uncharacterized protein n=1 Tax=Strombidium rassoulzadegani TaxID=1082188 RepID=A0A7S3CKP2_9SPIT|mmetsp:Transcript_14341/g.24416  ORF Transcript_14341/g.24416 Transcript_14341/m.24416 type:complete len:223 (+) Transcript_14341:259-927(+)